MSDPTTPAAVVQQGEGAKHTPGPWFFAAVDKSAQPVVTTATGMEVATCWHHCVGSIEKEAHANACLIAEAPAMLEALRDIERLARGRHGEDLTAAVDAMWRIAGTAVAKAARQ